MQNVVFAGKVKVVVGNVDYFTSLINTFFNAITVQKHGMK